MNIDNFKTVALHIVFLTGASGVGKTTLLDKLQQKIQDPDLVFLHFDSIGVPSEADMIKHYGSPSEWQRAMTEQWIYKIINEYSDKKLVILEGQINLSFITSTCERKNFTNYKIILLACDLAARHKRLHEDRQQPELVNEHMDNWSNFLTKQAIDIGATILDTTSLDTDDMTNIVMKWLMI